MQAAWLLFFGAYEDGARILAFQLLWQGMSSGAFVLRGLPFLRRAMREIDAGPLSRG